MKKYLEELLNVVIDIPLQKVLCEDQDHARKINNIRAVWRNNL